ncbi:hypothetical protein SprV_0100016200 [Sparganum proliferum]
MSGVFFFLHGFLLTRSELNTVAATTVNPPEFNRLILLLVDGLFFGLLPDPSQPPTQNDRMPYLTRLFHKSHLTSVPTVQLYHFLADPPTTTLQRLKALVTGSMPTFIDAGSNFGGTELQEDNLVKQWSLAGRKICFVGDQVWMELMPTGFLESFPLPSFNIKDLDTVDSAVREYFFKQLLPTTTSNVSKCDILIGHMLGVDHCGHTYGRKHPEMDRKLRELDDFLRKIVPQLTASDLLVVFGDHGMTLSGDHGGDSAPELDAAVLFYSPRGFPLLRQFAANDTPSMAQIDIVPTLAVLSGVPIPYSNLGVVESGLFGSKSQLRSAATSNFKQMALYSQAYQQRFGSMSLPTTIEAKLSHPPADVCRNVSACLAELHSLRSVFHRHWTRMDVPRSALGVITFVGGLLTLVHLDVPPKQASFPLPYLLAFGLLFLLLISLPLSLITDFLGLCLSMPLASGWTLTCLVSLCRIIAPRRRQQANQPAAARGGSLFSLLLMLLLTASYSSNSFVVQEARVLAFLLQTMLVASALFLLILPLPSRMLRPTRTAHPTPNRFLLTSLLCLALVNCGMRLEVCREESPSTSLCLPADNVWTRALATVVLPSRIELSFVTGRRLLLGLVGVSLWLGAHRYKLHRGGNLLGYSLISMSLKALVPFLGFPMVLLWILEACTAAIASAPNESVLRMPTITFLKVQIGRFILFVCGTAFCLLLRYPLLITHLSSKSLLKSSSVRDYASVDFLPPEAETTNSYDSRARVSNADTSRPGAAVSGLATVYSAWLTSAFVICPVFALLVLLGDACVLPLLGLFFCLLLPPIVILGAERPHFSVKDQNATITWALDAASSWPCAMYACLLGHFGFFVTGHQTTLSAIPWNAAFAVHQGDHTTNLLPGLLVLSHTFASQLLLTCWLPLLLVTAFQQVQHLRGKTAPPVEPYSEVYLFHSRHSAREFVLALDRLFRRYLLLQLLMVNVRRGYVRSHFQPSPSVLDCLICLQSVAFLDYSPSSDIQSYPTTGREDPAL